MNNRPLTARIVVIAAAALTLLPLAGQATAQVEPTPIVVQLATSTPLPVLGAPSATPVVPDPTATDIGPTQIEALSSVNVRAEASTDAARLGLIVPGERYAATGRYFRWIQFRYPNSPTGYGWVYDELVQIIGDPGLIPDLSVTQPTADPIVAAATQTAEAVASQPGGDLTATAGARVLTGPVGVDANATAADVLVDAQGSERLPTFTPVPNIEEDIAAASVQPTATTEPSILPIALERGGVPPLIPIVALVGFGMLGLVVSFRRR
ncbi:MAG: SH3 domain-containing protein [Chloroflexi bacterium]|nr:SH3 domain-containing protein [Chloroflexota bacterium]